MSAPEAARPVTEQEAASEPIDLSSSLTTGVAVVPSDIVDWATFSQILEMDEDEDEREFSTGIVLNFFEQAEATFAQMETALRDKNLTELSSLGHFLKGSSAALGLTKVKNSCEKIQHLGAGKDESGISNIGDPEISLQKIQSTLDVVRMEYAESQDCLKSYFGIL
jgi:osomolarity two-component system, phosphorelay intermediate protein YPD1